MKKIMKLGFIYFVLFNLWGCSEKTPEQAPPTLSPTPEITSTPIPTDQPTLEETVLIDNEFLTVTVLNLSKIPQPSVLGPSWNVEFLLENKTSFSLDFNPVHFRVNGLSLGYFSGSSTISPGKRKYLNLQFQQDYPSAYIGFFDLQFELYLTDNTLIHTTPVLNFKTSTFNPNQHEGTLVSNKLGVVIKSKPFEVSTKAISIPISIENNRDTSISFDCAEGLVDGKSTTFRSSYYKIINIDPHTTAITACSFSKIELSKNGIDINNFTEASLKGKIFIGKKENQFFLTETITYRLGEVIAPSNVLPQEDSNYQQGDLLFEVDGIRVSFDSLTVQVDPYSTNDFVVILKLLAENNRDQGVYVRFSNIYLDGVPIYDGGWKYVEAKSSTPVYDSVSTAKNLEKIDVFTSKELKFKVEIENQKLDTNLYTSPSFFNLSIQ